MAWVVMVAGAVTGVDSSADDSPASRVGTVFSSFTLQGDAGRTYKPRDVAGRRATIFAFVGTECPLSRMYIETLGELAKKYADQNVRVVGVDSNVQDSPRKILQFISTYHPAFPVLKDPGHVLADSVGASRVPEVYLVDHQAVVRYQGRIDDRLQQGVIHAEAKRHFLKEALDQVLAGQAVSVPYIEAIGCHIGRRQVSAEVPDSAPTWTGQVAAIIHAKCASCHRADDIGPFPLLTYEEAQPWAETIVEATADHRMPPWSADPAIGHFSNTRTLSDAERKILADWAAAGAPQGSGAEPKVGNMGRPSEWDLGVEPDLVLPIRSTPFDVPAQGPIPYQYFTVDLDVPPEGRWLSGVEVLPGNRAVVHHVLVYLRTKRARFGEGEGYLAAYVPGMQASMWPKGYAKFIPPNTQLYFQVHYTPTGRPEKDQTRIGLKFTERSRVTNVVATGSAHTKLLKIPPGDAHYKLVMETPAVVGPTEVLNLLPHMHMRGKSFKYDLVSADGKRTPLLDVPHYDYNWQTCYRFAKPLIMNKGDKIVCEAVFDNSSGNPFNPDPTKTVMFGPQAEDEMCFGYFDYAIPLPGGR